MHFSRVINGVPNDLELRFERAQAITWHEEALHSVSSDWPKTLPKLSGGKWNGWTYPLLQIHESTWIGRFDYMPHVKGLIHVALVSMDDIVEIVGNPAPSFRWIPKHEA